MTTILALDCATGPCSVALWHDGKIVAYVENLTPVVQSACLIPMVEEALKQGNLSYKDLTMVAATVGPGSFTGIRIGLAAAKGIAYAAGIPNQGYTTLEVLAFATRTEKNPTLALLQAGKGECYYQYFVGGTPVAEAQLGTTEQIMAQSTALPTAVCGNIALKNNDFIETGLTFPRADILAELAATASKYLPLTPLYIRPPDAKLPTIKQVSAC